MFQVINLVRKSCGPGMPKEILDKFVNIKFLANGPVDISKTTAIGDPENKQGQQRVYLAATRDVLDALSQAGKYEVCEWLKANTNQTIMLFAFEDCELVRTIPSPRWTNEERMQVVAELSLEISEACGNFTETENADGKAEFISKISGLAIRQKRLLECEASWLESRRQWILWGKKDK